jgi:putative membrane protein
MQPRSIIQYLLITAKGLAMGAADVVPGVSGGTIAFISGIYEELIETIHKLDFKIFKVWKKDGLKTAWNQYNLSFLTALFLGVAISVLSLAKVITWLLENKPIFVWSFFFGLVVASILYVGKQITKWDIKTIVAIIIAAGIAYYITLAKPIGSPESIWFLFFAGFIAIIAMILPGISGAFILLLLGAYKPVIGAIDELSTGISTMDWGILSQALLKIGVFMLGAIVGLKAFSSVLNWLFKNHKNLILATLTGFMIGALNKIWPWKDVLEYRISHDGDKVPFLEKSILPNSYEGEPMVLIALLFMVIGFLTIFLLEKIANKTKTE